MIEDPETEAVHESWDPSAELVHAEHDSVYLAVQTFVDGPVFISVHRGSVDEVDELTEVFAGTLQLRPGEVVIHDSDDRAVLRVRGKRGDNPLTLLTDGSERVARVMLIFGA
jgi:hypothetical protein